MPTYFLLWREKGNDLIFGHYSQLATATMYQAVLQQTTWIVNLVNEFCFIPEKAVDSFKAMFFI